MPGTSTELQDAIFDDIRLKVGDTLQMQPAGTLETIHYTVRYMGGLKGVSIMTTLPIVDHQGMWMRPGGDYIFRVLAGSSIYAFATKLLKARSHPYPYAHFGYPEVIRTKQVRQSPRIKLKLDSQAETADGQTLPVTLLDLSLDGALVEADGPLGDPGQTVSLHLPITLPEASRQLGLKAVIRNMADSERPLYGLEFQALTADETLLLHFYIDYQIAEGLPPKA